MGGRFAFLPATPDRQRTCTVLIRSRVLEPITVVPANSQGLLRVTVIRGRYRDERGCFSYVIRFGRTSFTRARNAQHSIGGFHPDRLFRPRRYEQFDVTRQFSSRAFQRRISSVWPNASFQAARRTELFASRPKSALLGISELSSSERTKITSRYHGPYGSVFGYVVLGAVQASITRGDRVNRKSSHAYGRRRDCIRYRGNTRLVVLNRTR